MKDPFLIELLLVVWKGQSEWRLYHLFTTSFQSKY